MPRVDFPDLPDHGRLWVFPLSRELKPGETQLCLEVVDAFLDQWAAHGMPLRSARELRDDRFLLVGVDVDAESPSGCSIDALVNRLRALGSDFGVTFIDHAPVWYRTEEGVRTASRAQFRELAAKGIVTLDSKVFDTSLTRVDQLRSGALEVSAAGSWHGRAFFKEAVSG